MGDAVANALAERERDVKADAAPLQQLPDRANGPQDALLLKVTTKTVWVTRVRMKDGSIRTFEQDAKPTWTRGAVVKATGGSLGRR